VNKKQMFCENLRIWLLYSKQ